MGVRLASLFGDAGHNVVLASRDVRRAARIAEGLGRRNIRGGNYDAAADAPVVLPAMFLRDGMFDTLEPLRQRLDGKLLIDITNPFNDRYDGFILPWNTSAAEQLQHRFPRARVVGAFKNVWYEVFDRPTFDGGAQLTDVYVVGDDNDAKREFFALVQTPPAPPIFRYVDAGVLENARYVERMTLFIAELGRRMGYFPRMNWRVMGEPWTPGQADRVKDLIARD
jgi:predicted dinucleotide-binding enzyme